MQYIEPIYRPPSEANSLILQVTNGCSWNHCSFCEMYTAPQKKFKVVPFAETEKHIVSVSQQGQNIRRVFLADGDVMTLSIRRLKQILHAILKHLPSVQRVSAYCLPRNVSNKSIAELKELQQLGLSLVYVGCESGDDEVLKMVNKGETFLSSKQALTKIHEAGIDTSIMILNGLGGRNFSEQHALHSAQLMNEIQPKYLSTLVVSFPQGQARFEQGFNGAFKMLTQPELFSEMLVFLQTLALKKTIFRSDHASNYLILKGVLNQDKDKLLQQVEQAMNSPENAALRPEWQRGL
jgi:radical SAM superfamily enzyme YgiQ (UPF0313 family)